MGGKRPFVINRLAAMVLVYENADRHILLMYVNTCAVRVCYSHGRLLPVTLRRLLQKRQTRSLSRVHPPRQAAPGGDDNVGCEKPPRADSTAGSKPLLFNALTATPPEDKPSTSSPFSCRRVRAIPWVTLRNDIDWGILELRHCIFLNAADRSGRLLD